MPLQLAVVVEQRQQVIMDMAVVLVELLGVGLLQFHRALLALVVLLQLRVDIHAMEM
jgi:hypothetical protein